jgi:hypothetical protein
MVTGRVRSTYTLDVETVASLKRLASLWGVSRSEVLRRLIRDAAEQVRLETDDPVEIWRQLQAHYGLTPASAREWEMYVKAERWGSRRKGRTS